MIPQTATSDTPSNWTGQGTILIIDDDMAVRKVTGLMLNQKVFKIFNANNGFAGVEINRDNREEISGVILDLVMPEMKGEQALDEMRKINPDVRVRLCSD